MMVDFKALFERIAETGTAPKDGCRFFGVGYDDAFARLKHKYLMDRFDRGVSAEKFIFGPFGSGKTHFLRQLMEVAREVECVTAEVALNKDVDVTQPLIVYKEVAQEIRVPGGASGIAALLDGALENVRAQARTAGVPAEDLSRQWAASIDGSTFSLEPFGRVLRIALESRLRGEEDRWLVARRWLGGEMADRDVTKRLGVSMASKAEQNLAGRRALLSLLQFVRLARFRGTVIGFDEAEQSLSVDSRKMERILSMLQSGINAINDLQNGAGLLVYAVTPGIVESMERFPALQQRVADPGPGLGFFDGNTLAAKVDLTKRPDPEDELRQIGRRLTELFFSQLMPGRRDTLEQAMIHIDEIALDVGRSDGTSSARREMAKRTCAWLMVKHDMASGLSDVSCEPEV